MSCDVQHNTAQSAKVLVDLMKEWYPNCHAELLGYRIKIISDVANCVATDFDLEEQHSFSELYQIAQALRDEWEKRRD